jgi:N-acetylmuramoyl-L-alanine amidase
VPQAIVEMGFLTSATDRQSLIGNPDRLARGLADGVSAFLSTLP